MMVDDLYDLIVNNKRAVDRNTRIKKFAEIFRFSTVPSSVNMV